MQFFALLSDIIDPTSIDFNGQMYPVAENFENIQPNYMYELDWTYCKHCHHYRPPGAHHCHICRHCILRMDHHCPWINNCCGYRNQKFFFNFLLAAVIGSMQSAILLSITLYRALTFIPNSSGQRYIHLTIWSAFLILISIGMAIGVVFAVGFLLYLQVCFVYFLFFPLI